MKRAIPSLLLLTCWALLPTPARAQTIQVSSASALQDAIDAVPSGGVIELAAGRYYAPGTSLEAPEGGWHINRKGKSFTIRAAQAGTAVLDGQSGRAILRIVNDSLGYGRPITFQGLVFENGVGVATYVAGGVTLLWGEATFLNCTFRNNEQRSQTGGGGGVLVGQGSTAFFFDSTWENNRAVNMGGAIELNTGSRAYVDNSTFTGNRTNLPQHFAWAAGGAIHVVNATLRVTNTRFEGNQAGYVGGAVYALGSWSSTPATPASHVIIANSTFVNNRATRDPSVSVSAPTEGGAVHAEDQTTLEIYQSRFVTNSADTGGAVNLYRATVVVADSAFRGNWAAGGAGGTGFGGAISAVSNDANDPTTDYGATNRRPANLTVRDSYFEGQLPGQGVITRTGGCLYLRGDGARLFGQGVPAMGGVDENRAVATVARSVLYRCDATEAGGAILTDIASLALSDSIVSNSNATGAGGAGFGGGLSVLDQSLLTLTNTFVVNNTTSTFGGGLFAQGSTLNLSGNTFIANSAPASGGYGSAIFAAPDEGRSVNVTGTVQNNVFVDNYGALTLFDDDRTAPLPVNAVLYVNNQLRPQSGTLVYQHAQAGTKDAAGLNNMTAPRDKGSGNSAPASDPATGRILAVPSRRLASAAPGDAVTASNRTAAYVGYGWSGPTNASVSGTSVSGFSGAGAVTSGGVQTLAVSGLATQSDIVDDSPLPSATLGANPATIKAGSTSQLTWSSVGTPFLEAGLDQGVGSSASASGVVNVSPMETTVYRYLAVTETGSARAEATVTATGAAGPRIVSFTASTVLTSPGQPTTLSWAIQSATYATLNGSTVSAAIGSTTVAPATTTSYTLTATSSGGSASAVVTVQVRDGALGYPAPAVTAPWNGQVIAVRGVTFSWQAVGGVGGYGLRIFRRSTGQVVFSGSLLGQGSTSTLIGLPDGDYSFAVRACRNDFTSGECGQWATVDFAVRLNAPAAAPTITAPPAQGTLTSSTNAFSWTTIPGASSYEIVVSDVADAEQPRVVTQVAVAAAGSGQPPDTSTIITLPGGTYEAVVRACQSGCGPSSPPVRFTMQLRPAPTAAPQVSRPQLNGNNLTVAWTAVSGADLYRVEVIDPSGGPGGGALTVASRQTAAVNATFPVPPTGPGKSYSVLVRACTGNGCGPAGSQAISFSDSPPPSTPQIGSPMSGTIVIGPLLQFAWSRVPGDTGSNTLYRLYVQDMARAAAALDVFTLQSFYGAYFKAEGTRYDALVFASQDGGKTWGQGPPVAFIVSGASAVAPTMVAPTHQCQVQAGNVQLGWSPVPGATLYEYFVAVQGQPNATVRGVTTGLFVQVPLRNPATYSAIVRACPAGNACAFDSDAGWGPWSVNAGPGVTNFTVTP